MKFPFVIIALVLSTIKLSAQLPYFPNYSDFEANKLSIFNSEANYSKYLEQENEFTKLSKNDFDEFCELTAFTKRNLITTGQV